MPEKSVPLPPNILRWSIIMRNSILKLIFSALFLSFPCAYFTAEGECVSPENPAAAVKATDEVTSLYHAMQLEGVVNWKAFKLAVTGYNRIKGRKREVLTLIDFSKPSTEKRLYVFDMKHRRMLYSSVVSHGKNSGGNYATSFSNEYGSYKSSLGFYLTASTYQGKNGYSLVLDGLEKGINDRARERAIVVHGAAYADPSVAKRGGRLGRSFGCPALPTSVARPIIDTIKGGSVMYIYAETPSYLAQSSILSDSDVNVTVNQ